MRRPTPLTRDELDRHPLPPVVEADKDARGKLLVIGGSIHTPGSVAIAARAAMRAGCGKISVATAESMAPHVALHVPEAYVLAVPQGRAGGPARSAIKTVLDYAADCQAVVAGPGMQPSEGAEAMTAGLLKLGHDRLVLDAGTLYALPGHDRAARAAEMPILLPHDREMAALLDCDPEEVNAEPLRCGLDCAARYGALTLVKGARSHIVTPDGRVWIYKGGGPGLGISGSGDTLAGILGGLLARGTKPLNALLWAVWLHGEAGSVLARKVGTIGYLAREISDEVPALLPS